MELSKKEYLTTQQVAEIFGLSKKWLENMRWQKKGIPYVKAGKKVLYRRQDVEDWLEKHMVKVVQEA